MGEIEMNTKLLSQNLKVTDHPQDLGVDRNTILAWIRGK